MKTISAPPRDIATLIALLSLALIASGVRADEEDRITRSFSVQPGGQLTVLADRGAIEVKTVPHGTSVDVEISRTAKGSKAKAEQTLKDHVVTLTQDGSKVEIHAEYQGEKAARWFGRSPELQVKYLISVPRKFDIKLATAGGSIKVADLSGKAEVRTSGGSLSLEKMEGPVSGHTSGGSIRLGGCLGSVDVRTTGGSISLSEVAGPVTASTSGGSIRAEKMTGKAELKTSGGSIHIAEMRGSVEANTSGGNISADLAEPPAEACSFRTSGGSISITLGATAAVEVDLHTTGGRVSSEFPVTTVVQGNHDQNSLHGTVNGGGPLLTARTSGGSVRLQKR